MRRIAWVLLLLFAFAIPWEYSLDLGEPLGNVARIAGLLVLLAAIPAVLQAGRMRTPSAFCWLVLALYLWFCCTCFWTIDSVVDARKAARLLSGDDDRLAGVGVCRDSRRSAQPLARHRRRLVGAGRAHPRSPFSSPEAIAAGQIRFAAYGQDPNEVARFLDLGFPLAALSRALRAPLAAAPHGLRLSAARPRRRSADSLARRISCRLVALAGCCHSSCSRSCRRVVAAALCSAAFSRRPLVHRSPRHHRPSRDHPRAVAQRRLEPAPQHLVRRLARLRPRAALRHRRRILCRRSAPLAHRHRAQHRAVHCWSAEDSARCFLRRCFLSWLCVRRSTPAARCASRSSHACWSGPSPRSSPRSRRTAPHGCFSASSLVAGRLLRGGLSRSGRLLSRSCTFAPDRRSRASIGGAAEFLKVAPCRHATPIAAPTRFSTVQSQHPARRHLGWRSGNPRQAHRHRQGDRRRLRLWPLRCHGRLSRRSAHSQPAGQPDLRIHEPGARAHAGPGEGTGGPRSRPATALEFDAVDVPASRR